HPHHVYERAAAHVWSIVVRLNYVASSSAASPVGAVSVSQRFGKSVARVSSPSGMFLRVIMHSDFTRAICSRHSVRFTCAAISRRPTILKGVETLVFAQRHAPPSKEKLRFRADDQDR